MTNTPRVQLIGDSIAVGYAPLAALGLAGRADVLPPPANSGDSANLLARLEEWVLKSPPDLLHLNVGLHDLRRWKPDGRYQQPLDAFRANLEAIFTRLTAAMPGRVIWATITPVMDSRQAGGDFSRQEADVAAYNAAARTVVEGFPACAAAAGGPARAAASRVNDLHDVIQSAGLLQCVSSDGVHMTDIGYRLLADAVVGKVREGLKR